MDPFSPDRLSRIFKVSDSNPNLIGSRESSTLEFKESFNSQNMREYARVMASYANASGGYIVFGVKDKPREILGIDPSRFDNIDIARATATLNQVFSPAIRWTMHVQEWLQKSFGLIYTYEAAIQPIVATSDSADIRDGDVFYRYNARTQRIRFGELLAIIEARVSRERDSWRRVFENAASIGPENARIVSSLDIDPDQLPNPVLVDSNVLAGLDLRPAAEGESGGRPVYEVSGLMHPAAVLGIKQMEVPVHTDMYVYRPANVAKEVARALGKPFRVQSEHIKAWRDHGVRPHGTPSTLPFRNDYCEYKDCENDYRYSRRWLDELIAEYSVDENYNRLQGLPVAIARPGKPWITTDGDSRERPISRASTA